MVTKRSIIFFTLLVLTIIVVVALTNVTIIRFTSDGCQMVGKTPQYWESDKPIPDGQYEVLIYEYVRLDAVCVPHSIFFPNCPSYGGQLHGEWNVSEDVTLPKDLKMKTYDNGKTVLYGWCFATIENDTIVTLEMVSK